MSILRDIFIEEVKEAFFKEGSFSFERIDPQSLKATTSILNDSIDFYIYFNDSQYDDRVEIQIFLNKDISEQTLMTKYSVIQFIKYQSEEIFNKFKEKNKLKIKIKDNLEHF